MTNSSNDDRISRLEADIKKLRENDLKLKELIQYLNKRLSVLEGGSTPKPKPISDEWTVTYRDDVSTTLYNEYDDLGCVIKATVYNDSLMDLEEGETYSNLKIPSNIKLTAPVTVRGFVYSAKTAGGCLYLKWKGKCANLFKQGIVNREDINQEFKEIVTRKNLTITKHGGYDLKETMTLKVLPYFVEKAGWKLKTY